MNGDTKVNGKYIVENKLSNVGGILSKSTYMLVKRTFDIVCGLFGTLCLVPLAGIVKISYLLTGDTKSIFYSQKRIGLDGKEFELYKFRSMVPNADEELKEMLKNDETLAEEYRVSKKLSNDPRITKAGRILRRTSLDEMPQMLNVLKGEMSIVGNRPYLPREKEDMGDYYGDIIKSKPGLTGLWQVAGRSDTTFLKRLRLEQYYSKKMSLKMDIKIFLRTFKVVFFGNGAK